MAPKAKSTLLIRLLLGSILSQYLGNPDAFAGPVRSFPFWACSDGKGSVTLFWLPPGGQWPVGGFRLERIVRRRPVLLAKSLGPALDREALAELPSGDAAKIQALAEKIREGTLTDEERRHSISVMGKTAATDPAYGRALGVRYTDRAKGGGKILYRLAALDADGRPVDTMESNEVNPSRRTPGPAQPLELTALEHPGAVGLSWSDPPASVLAPVVAYRVERIAGRGKAEPLTPAPLILNRHLAQDRPDFLDADPPREQLVYRVRSIDIFGRVSAPTRVEFSAKNLPPPAAPVQEPAPPAAVEKKGEPLIRGKRTAMASPPVRQSPAPKPPPGEAPVNGKEAGPDPASSVAAPAPDRAKPAPAILPPESVPPPPAESRETRTEIVPDREDRPIRAEEVNEEAVSAERSSGDRSSREESAKAESYPVVRLVPDALPAKPTPKPAPAGPATNPRPLARKETGLPTAKGSSSIAGGAGSGAGRTAAAVRGETGPPPSPTIMTIVGLGDKVSITFRPGEPEEAANQFLVYRSESPTGPGVIVGRPVRGDARQWEDPTVEAGQYFWYRIVAVDRAGNRSPPSKPKWVAVGSH